MENNQPLPKPENEAFENEEELAKVQNEVKALMKNHPYL